ncbi:phosphomannomutase CpsG [Vibrio sp. JC009]|uniref:phosphomannomutase CpsG n=1 Tax=Vibrio sp. JC009 TaxID=2912314 RepID=UPI0023B0A118|nr:phosphomannomutase CpsG [Vibrio sp. JC009]WED21994.1 phosphomannomutase CpsG [Vibrio sp. JC009]
MEKLTCFKAYDIRGQLEKEISADIAYRIGRAFGQFLQKSGTEEKTVVVGGDVRLTSEELKLALSDGLNDAGVNVLDIGLSGTEEVYFATFHLGVQGGVEVTASHNPIDYNGMKIVLEGSRPLSRDCGLEEIQELAENNCFVEPVTKGNYKKISILEDYVDHLLGYVAIENIKPMKLVINSGNGAAGHVIDELEARFRKLDVPLEIVKVHNDADGNFPNGIPNPLLPECREDTAAAVKKHNADIGIAFDGDFDRCFFFDEYGNFIEGYYIVGMLAEAFLQKEANAKIIHDPRLTWSTIQDVKNSGGVPVLSKTGHAFIKEKMRDEDAVYGGEMSAHHYFRDFAYCDSGMIPWLLVTELLSLKEISLSGAIESKVTAYPCSGEINYKVANAKELISKIEFDFGKKGKIDKTDGLSIEFDDWRFNIRTSNTEPLLRLNIESKRNKQLVNDKVLLLESYIKA